MRHSKELFKLYKIDVVLKLLNGIAKNLRAKNEIFKKNFDFGTKLLYEDRQIVEIW